MPYFQGFLQPTWRRISVEPFRFFIVELKEIWRLTLTTHLVSSSGHGAGPVLCWKTSAWTSIGAVASLSKAFYSRFGDGYLLNASATVVGLKEIWWLTLTACLLAVEGQVHPSSSLLIWLLNYDRLLYLVWKVHSLIQDPVSLHCN